MWIGGVAPNRNKLCAITHFAAIVVMNIMEFIVVPGLLYFIRLKIVIASLFMLMAAL